MCPVWFLFLCLFVFVDVVVDVVFLKARSLGTQKAAAVLLHPGQAISIPAARLTVISTHQRSWGGVEEGGGGAQARRAGPSLVRKLK